MAKRPAHIPGKGSLRDPPPVAIERIKKFIQRRSAKKTSLRVAALNITSFLDMCFCLLTFLIMAANFSSGAEAAISAKLPQIGINGYISDGKEVPKLQRTLYIKVSGGADGNYQLLIEGTGQATTSFSQLTAYLAKMRMDPRTNPTGAYDDDTLVVIKPVDASPWQGAVSAYNSAVKARFKNVSFQRDDE